MSCGWLKHNAHMFQTNIGFCGAFRANKNNQFESSNPLQIWSENDFCVCHTNVVSIHCRSDIHEKSKESHVHNWNVIKKFHSGRTMNSSFRFFFDQFLCFFSIAPVCQTLAIWFECLIGPQSLLRGQNTFFPSKISLECGGKQIKIVKLSLRLLDPGALSIMSASVLDCTPLAQTHKNESVRWMKQQQEATARVESLDSNQIRHKKSNLRASKKNYIELKIC